MTTDTERESLRKNLWRAVAAMLVVGAVLYVASIVSVVADPENRSPTGNVVGVDYSSFHAGATMLRYGDAQDLYDIDAMTELLREVRRGPAGRQPTFLNPPAFAMVLTPLASLRYEAGLLIWTVVGFVVFGWGLRAIGTPRLGIVAGAAVLSISGFLGVSLGQGQFFWAAIYAGILSRLHAGKQVQAGMLAALLALKPQLLVPVVLWWIVDWRRNRSALGSALLGAAAISVIPAVIFPGSYTGYGTLIAAASNEFPLNGIPMGVTLRDAVDAFAGGRAAWSGALVVVGISLFVAVLVMGVRARWDPDLMFIVATSAGLLTVSHLLLYDWLLLVPAGVLFVRKIPPRSMVVPASIAALLFAALFQVVFGVASFERFGRSIQFAPVVLVVVIFVVVRQLQGLRLNADTS